MRARVQARARMAEFFAAFFVAASRLAPSAWLSENIVLPGGHQESEVGAVRFETRPYLREPIDCITAARVRDVVWIGPTRAGKTFILRMVFAYVVAVLRLPVLWYDSTIDKARSISKKELQPLIEGNRVLRSRKPDNRDHYSNTQMLFPGAHFEMFGANSDAQASGETAAVVLGNEIGKWRQATAKEASILEQTRHRTESFEAQRRHFFSSTPTTENGLEWIEYLKGDRRLWHVPCPCCGHLQALTWRQVIWAPEAKRPDGTTDGALAAATARYHCEAEGCGSRWDQATLWAAVRNVEGGARWIPTAEPAEPGFRSYHLSGLYGPLESNTMADLVARYHAARRDAFYATRQDFWNSGMGLPWLNETSSADFENLAALERDYLRGELPAGFDPDLLIIGADVQTWGLPWVLVAIRWSGESYVLDYGTAATFEDLEDVQTAAKRFRAPSYVIIDIQFEARRPEVQRAIFERKARGWWGAEGFEVSRQLVRLDTMDPFIGTRLESKHLRAPKLVISLYAFKIELEKRLAGKLKLLFFPSLPLTAAEGDVEHSERKSFFTQLLDERRVPRERVKVGFPPDEFKSRRGNNHAFDCLVYSLALFFYLSSKRRARAAKDRPAPREVAAE